MSFAHKLWKIGNALTEQDIRDALTDPADNIEKSSLNFLNINFELSNDEITHITLNKNSIEKEKLFFTKKIGGAGEGIYYLYPNLSLQASLPKEKIKFFINTLDKCMIRYANENNRKILSILISKLAHTKECLQRGEIELNIDKLKIEFEKLTESIRENTDEKIIKKNKKELKKTEQIIKKNEQSYKKLMGKNIDWDPMLLSLCRKIVAYEKNDYWIWLSVNNITFYELMPEVWKNWYQAPIPRDKQIKKGYDVFTNQKTEIGFKPDVKVFSYDQYHDSMKYRLNDNLPLSQESARNIKFAWMYILKNLVFYYKGLEYIIIPSLITNDTVLYGKVVNRLKRANAQSGSKRSILEKLKKQEKDIEKEINKLKKKKEKQLNEKKLLELEGKRKELTNEKERIDTGFFKESEEQIQFIGDLIHSITIDFIFTKINRTNLSFEIKGSIEDVIPSQVRRLVQEMNNSGINDLVKLGKRNREKTHLQDFFNRDELSFALTRSQKQNANRIFQERLYLAKLLLSENQIKLDQLLDRFEYNRIYGYDKKKRMTKDKILEWIEFPDKFVRDEKNILCFLSSLNKIKE